MKSQISAVDLHYLISEMRVLERGRIDQIYHPGKEELLLQFHVPGRGKKILRIIPGKSMFLSEYKESHDEPSGFCMFLRKYLANTKLKEILQIGNERIALLVFEGKNGSMRLYAELFGKGNIVLTDDKDIIINALHQQKWADREIKKGNKYVYPKKDDYFKKENFSKALKSDKEIVLKLARDIGLGGAYAEEVCSLCGIDKKKKVLSEKDVEDIFREFNGIYNKEIKAIITSKDGKIDEVLPYKLEKSIGSDIREFDSFNSAFDYFFREGYEKKEFVSKNQAIIDKTASIIEQQKRQVLELERKAEEDTKKGELIYENYQGINEILNELKKAREKYSFKEIRDKLKGHKMIKEVDEKNKKVIIEL